MAAVGDEAATLEQIKIIADALKGSGGGGSGTAPEIVYQRVMEFGVELNTDYATPCGSGSIRFLNKKPNFFWYDHLWIKGVLSYVPALSVDYNDGVLPFYSTEAEGTPLWIIKRDDAWGTCCLEENEDLMEVQATIAESKATGTEGEYSIYVHMTGTSVAEGFEKYFIFCSEGYRRTASWAYSQPKRTTVPSGSFVNRLIVPIGRISIPE